MLIFPGVPGRVVVMRPTPAAGLIRFIQIKPILSFDTHRVLITRVGISKSCNYQLQHSLGSVVYVYVFGDRVGSIVINGLAVGGPVSYGAVCDYENGTGIDFALAYFDKNRIANAQTASDNQAAQSNINEGRLGRNRQLPVPPLTGDQVRNREIEVIVGTTPIRGFLTDMQLNILNPEFQLAEFTLTLRTIPEVMSANPGLESLQGFGQGGAPAGTRKGKIIAEQGF